MPHIQQTCNKKAVRMTRADKACLGAYVSRKQPTASLLNHPAENTQGWLLIAASVNLIQ